MNELQIQEADSLLLLSASDDGSGDVLLSVEVRCDGFSGHADGVVVASEWETFVQQLAALETERKGSARLSSALGELDFKVHSIDNRGHMGVSGVLSYHRVGVEEWPVQQLHFAFEFEPSKLAAFASDAANAQQRAAGDVRNARA
jgi:hypothetical protein